MKHSIESNDIPDAELSIIAGGAPVAPQHQAYLKSSYQRNGAIWGGLAGAYAGGPRGAWAGAKQGWKAGGALYERNHGPNSR